MGWRIEVAQLLPLFYFKEIIMSPLEQSRFMNQMGVYNKIQDRLMYLGNNAIINMVIMLYSENEKYGRRYYYREVKYNSNSINVPIKKISREFDAYITLENLKPVNGIKEFIIIRGRDLELMRMSLLPKFENMIQNFDSIFELRKGKMYVTDKVKPFAVDIGATKSLLFVPGMRKLYNDEMLPCIDLYLNSSSDNVVSLTFPQLYEFMYLIRTFQIHQYAVAMLNYLGRPPAGTNLYDATEMQEYDNIANMETTVNRRPIGGNRQSYFDKKDDSNGEQEGI